MKPFAYYNATIAFPRRAEFTVDGAFDQAAYSAKLAQYRADDQRLFTEFKKDCMKFTGIADLPVAEIIFNRACAWDKGKGNGYEEVFTELLDLVDFLVDIGGIDMPDN